MSLCFPACSVSNEGLMETSETCCKDEVAAALATLRCGTTLECFAAEGFLSLTL